LLLPSASADEAATLARLDRLERRLEIGAVTSGDPVPVTESLPKVAEPAAVTAPKAPMEEAPRQPEAPHDEAPAAPADPGALDAAGIRRVWPEILEAAKARRRTTHALLAQHATVVDVRGRTLVIAIEHAPLLRQFDMGGNADVLVEALRQVLGVEWKVETVAGAGTPSRSVPEPTPEGFAPGDAPVDVDADDAESGSDDAISLLTEGLGAQVIGEVDTT